MKLDKRKIEENFFKTLMIGSTLIILAGLALILALVIAKGIKAMNLDMLTRTPQGGYYLGKEGGILNAILGSLYLAGGASVVAILISLCIVLSINVYAKFGSRWVNFIRFSLDVLWGVPSIVYGAFGLGVMLFLGVKASLLSGIIVVALLILPIMTRIMDEVLRMIPKDLFDASYALGATKLETALKVIVRQALPGISTAVLISFGRGIGDAASVIFTTGFTDSIPQSLFAPVATLPLAIFFQLGSPIAEVQGRAYAASLILTLIILAVSIVSRLLNKKLTEHVLD
ncbi:MAG: ABC transporter permease subunit [Candidatus Omnitrophica bacterium]|nr:ABC transporter permease subunit [Candidatus Omnitrophota bacterium]